jgi:hypothetical protein
MTSSDDSTAPQHDRRRAETLGSRGKTRRAGPQRNDLIRELVAVLWFACAACATGPGAVPIAAPLPSTAGPVRNACESEGMIELVPSRAFSTASDFVSATTVRTIDVAHSGLGLFRRNGSGPLPLVDLLPQLGEPELTSLHVGRIAPTHRKLQRQGRARRTFGIASLTLTGVGGFMSIHGLLADNNTELAAGAITLGVSLAVSMIGFAVVYRDRPSPLEITYHDVRTNLLIAGEDDGAAAARGVDRYNEAVRARCGSG